MKRSKVIDKIVYVMQNNHPALDYKDVAEQILDSIEDLGMLPPLENGQGCPWTEWEEE